MRSKLHTELSEVLISDALSFPRAENISKYRPLALDSTALSLTLAILLRARISGPYIFKTHGTTVNSKPYTTSAHYPGLGRCGHTTPPRKLNAPAFVRLESIDSVASGSIPPSILRAGALT